MEVISKEAFIVTNKCPCSKPASIPQTSAIERAFEKEVEKKTHSIYPFGNGAPGPMLARQLLRRKFRFKVGQRVEVG